MADKKNKGINNKEDQPKVLNKKKCAIFAPNKPAQFLTGISEPAITSKAPSDTSLWSATPTKKLDKKAKSKRKPIRDKKHPKINRTRYAISAGVLGFLFSVSKLI